MKCFLLCKLICSSQIVDKFKIIYELFDRREFDITTDEEERFEYNGDAEENESDTESRLSSHNNSLLSPLG